MQEIAHLTIALALCISLRVMGLRPFSALALVMLLAIGKEFCDWFWFNARFVPLAPVIDLALGFVGAVMGLVALPGQSLARAHARAVTLNQRF